MAEEDIGLALAEDTSAAAALAMAKSLKKKGKITCIGDEFAG